MQYIQNNETKNQTIIEGKNAVNPSEISKTDYYGTNKEKGPHPQKKRLHC